MTARLLSAAMVFLASGAPAQEDATRLAESCAPCHGNAGQGGGSIPAIAGQSEAQLARRMHELAAGVPQATIMTRLMRAYDDAEIAALARHFSRAKP